MNSTIFLHKERREGEAAKKLLPAACQNNLASGGVQCVFLFFHTHCEPIPFPLGKAKEKVRTMQLVPTDAIPVSNSFLCLLFVFLASSRLHYLVEQCSLCHGASTSISVMMGYHTMCICQRRFCSGTSSSVCCVLSPVSQLLLAAIAGAAVGRGPRGY